jgi:hypothetical protein
MPKLYIVHVADEALLGMHHLALSTTLTSIMRREAIAVQASKILEDAPCPGERRRG